jgi:hypothetical protein
MCCHTPHSLAPEVNEPVIQNSWYTLLNTTMLESWQLRLHFQESHICECVQHDASFLDHTQVVWLVKVKLCLYKPWKFMGAEGVQLYSFLAVALDGSEVNIMHRPARSLVPIPTTIYWQCGFGLLQTTRVIIKWLRMHSSLIESHLAFQSTFDINRLIFSNENYKSFHINAVKKLNFVRMRLALHRLGDISFYGTNHGNAVELSPSLLISWEPEPHFPHTRHLASCCCHFKRLESN